MKPESHFKAMWNFFGVRPDETRGRKRTGEDRRVQKCGSSLDAWHGKLRLGDRAAGYLYVSSRFRRKPGEGKEKPKGTLLVQDLIMPDGEILKPQGPACEAIVFLCLFLLGTVDLKHIQQHRNIINIPMPCMMMLILLYPARGGIRDSGFGTGWTESWLSLRGYFRVCWQSRIQIPPSRKMPCQAQQAPRAWQIQWPDSSRVTTQSGWMRCHMPCSKRKNKGLSERA
jgi:hypothetical protein